MSSPRLVVPRGGLVLLVGASGSGKSTLAARHFDPAEVLSSDAFREAVSGDAADQSATQEAFQRLHAKLDQRMAAGLRTVVDATNVQPWARRELLAVAREHGRDAVALVLAPPVEVCLAWNAERPGRTVPEAIIRKQDRELRASLSRMHTEGYASMVVLVDVGQVEDLQVVLE